MKRRQAIQNMLLLSGGSLVLYACGDWLMPSYENLLVIRRQRKAIGDLTEAILPRGEEIIENLKSTTDFILTQINDCFSLEDIEKFLTGMNEYMVRLEEKNIRRLNTLAPVDQLTWLKYFENGEGLSKNLLYFYRTNKWLTKQHFTSSEYVMTQILDFQFVPGRFDGCAEI